MMDTNEGRADDTKVICPACAHQFRAIPAQVQGLLLASGHEPPFTQPAPEVGGAKPLDDPRLQQLFGDAIDGALSLGYQNSSPPPAGHWLQRFWDIGRGEATKAAQVMGALKEATSIIDALDGRGAVAWLNPEHAIGKYTGPLSPVTVHEVVGWRPLYAAPQPADVMGVLAELVRLHECSIAEYSVDEMHAALESARRALAAGATTSAERDR